MPTYNQQVRAATESKGSKELEKQQDGLYMFEYIGTVEEQLRSAHFARGGELSYVRPSHDGCATHL
jgi:hypothetical protein